MFFSIEPKREKSPTWPYSTLTALVVSFIVLAIMVYKRVDIGTTLISTAMVMAFLSMNPLDIINVLLLTTTDLTTISLVLVTIGIMLLSLFYKETHAIDSLSKSFSSIFRNPKFIVSAPPAIIGLLPVPGGALMSAPFVKTESKRLGLEREKKTYVNIWFRHVIFPIYPMSQILILTAALTRIPLTAIIVGQIPVVVAMVIIGYFAALKKATVNYNLMQKTTVFKSFRNFFVSFSPILTTILIAMILGVNVAKQHSSV